MTQVDIMTAAEARAATEGYEYTKITNELEILAQAISSAVQDGYYHVVVSDIHPENKEYLQQLGYKIVYIEYGIDIIWEEEEEN